MKQDLLFMLTMLRKRTVSLYEIFVFAKASLFMLLLRIFITDKDYGLLKHEWNIWRARVIHFNVWITLSSAGMQSQLLSIFTFAHLLSAVPLSVWNGPLWVPSHDCLVEPSPFWFHFVFKTFFTTLLSRITCLYNILTFISHIKLVIHKFSLWHGLHLCFVSCRCH